jgi:polysaccharide export outer membrane protein
MKALLSSMFCTMLSISLLPAGIGIAAQQVPTKPVQSATPAPAPTDVPAPLQTDVPTQVQPPPQAPPAVQPSAANVVPTTYVIGPDDSIGVTVWREPTLSGTFPVRPDGMISLALVGDIMAAGRTPADLGVDITARLKKFLTDPTVAVTVLAVNSKKVFILGEVAHIGPIPLNTTMNPLQAISAAGGLTPYAHKSQIYILRGEQGKQKKIAFDYKKAIEGNYQGMPLLLPGDTIVVK